MSDQLDDDVADHVRRNRAADGDHDDSSVEQRLDRIERERESQRLANEHGLSLEHAEELGQLTRNGLAEDEALLVIEKRHELGPPIGATHGSLRPRSGRVGAPRKSPREAQAERLDRIREISKTDKRAGSRAFNTEVGRQLAQVMGWEHGASR